MNSEDFGKRGSPETSLIPGALRVYRHFRADCSGRLFPPSAYQIMEAWNWISSSRGQLMQNPRKGGYVQTETRTEGYRVAGPIEFARGVQYAECLLSRSLTLKQHEEPAPEPTCRCGFYAHYDPHGSFYDHTSASFANGAPVKGVCQVSGRVLMGEKGVRAERIEILGIAPGEVRFLPSSIREMAKISERYQVPAFESVAEMVESFPPDDVSELLKR